MRGGKISLCTRIDSTGDPALVSLAVEAVLLNLATGSDRSFLCSDAAEYTRVSAAEIRHAAARRMQFRFAVVLVLVFV